MCQGPAAKPAAPYSGLVAHAVDVSTHRQHRTGTPPLPAGARRPSAEHPSVRGVSGGACVLEPVERGSYSGEFSWVSKDY